MKRSAIAVAAALWAAVALSGCPLPQPVAEYPKNKVAPPLIVTSSIAVNGVGPGGVVNGASVGAATILVPAGCPVSPQYVLGATVSDTDVAENVVARWFVDYVPDFAGFAVRAKYVEQDFVPQADQPNPSTPILTRTVPAFAFSAYGYDSTTGLPRSQAGNVHVVDLVVSNDTMWPEATGTPLPFRSTSSDNYETQVYRWVFLLVDPATTPGVSCP